MFACPILKQQSSDINPPMKLVCGHIISKDAVQKLGSSSNKYDRFYFILITIKFKSNQMCAVNCFFLMFLG